MTFGVFMHRSDSIYDDEPAERYQFPKNYLDRARGCVGDWIVYLEPRKVPQSRGYFAVAKVQTIVSDPTAPNMYLALIEAGSYLEFSNPVPFRDGDGVVETGVLNDAGAVSGRAQAAVRPLSRRDFQRIVDRGLGLERTVMPRLGQHETIAGFAQEQERFGDVSDADERVRMLGSRAVRDRVFRQLVLDAYDSTCAITGLKLINGGGRAEVQAAHIRPVEFGGPDKIGNGIALSGTVHWMFDRGLLSLTDDLQILVSRQVNDAETIRAMIYRSGLAASTRRAGDRPHPRYLEWHRQNCFKQ